jgi:DNA processing protein
MPDPTERAALVALLRTGSQPWSVYTDVVEERGSALAVFHDEVAGRRPQASLFADDSDELLNQADADIRGWSRRGMTLLTVLDAAYPENLRAVHDRPPFIFVAGRLQAADSRSVAVVGTRTPSPRGLAQARAIAEHLAECGYVVASGLAAGVDTAAHTAALARARRTIAVIGTGLGRAYPPENAELQRRIAASCAVISQFWPDSPPSRRSFPMRNAVMSGLALATVVIEASYTSGSRMQARLALAHGRPVFLMESLLDQDWARQCAARSGTHVVRRPADVTAVIERLTSSGALVA